jgi:hypothetical protein
MPKVKVQFHHDHTFFIPSGKAGVAGTKTEVVKGKVYEFEEADLKSLTRGSNPLHADYFAASEKSAEKK